MSLDRDHILKVNLQLSELELIAHYSLATALHLKLQSTMSNTVPGDSIRILKYLEVKMLNSCSVKLQVRTDVRYWLL